LALREQGVGGDLLALDLEGVEQRDGHFDLVGALDFVAILDRQGTYFIGV
jgi:hypothetical protein